MAARVLPFQYSMQLFSRPLSSSFKSQGSTFLVEMVSSSFINQAWSYSGKRKAPLGLEAILATMSSPSWIQMGISLNTLSKASACLSTGGKASVSLYDSVTSTLRSAQRLGLCCM